MAIVLEKSGDQHRINLEKGGASSMGEIIINLNWSKGSLMKQIFGKPIDLDLGCFYELRDGKKMLMMDCNSLITEEETAISKQGRDVTITRLTFGIKVMTEVVALLLGKQSM